MQKGDRCLILSERSYCVFALQGFITKCFLIFIVDEVKNFAANYLPKLVIKLHTRIRTIGQSRTGIRASKGGIHILKSSEVLKQQKVSVVSSSTGIVKSRDKDFILGLKLLFTIVDCFLRRFPPRFFYCETSLFHWFSLVIISCLIYFSALHDFDMILMFVCFNKFYS